MLNSGGVTSIVYVLSDLHLGTSVDKPMDVFGDAWDAHQEKIKRNWHSIVGADDTVFLPGDISWGIDLVEALADFRFLHELPGKKILSKGNHDYWWSTVGKTAKALADAGIDSIDFLHNNAFFLEGKVFCGTKGYLHDLDETDDYNNRISQRERERFSRSLQAGQVLREQYDRDAPLIALLHYPPITKHQRNDLILELLKKHGVSRCYYGHIHGAGKHAALTGVYEQIELHLVSADAVDFCPQKV